MAFTRRAMRNGSAVAGIALTMAVALAAPATASTNGATASEPSDSFSVCIDTMPCMGSSAGDVSWTNRSAIVQGYVEDLDNDGSSTTVYFEAYAGTKKIASTTRTASEFESVSYKFAIGDPDLVGGFDRLKIQICLRNSFACSDPVHAHRDGWPEQLN